MPIYRGIIQKNFFGEFLVNDYNISAPDMEAAMAFLETIAHYEAALFIPGIVINTLRVSSLPQGDNYFYTKAVNIPGTRTYTGALTPPFNRFRVDMGVGFRRPLRKYLLIPLTGDVNGGGLSSAAQTLVNTSYCQPLVALGCVVAINGTIVGSASVSERVGMRQLRRGSKRRSTPVI